MCRPVLRSLPVSSHREIVYAPFVLPTEWLPTFPSCLHPAENKREPFPMPPLHLRPARRPHPVRRVPPDILYMIIVHMTYVPHLEYFIFFPRYFSTKMTGACPVTTDLIVRVHVRTATTIRLEGLTVPLRKIKLYFSCRAALIWPPLRDPRITKNLV